MKVLITCPHPYSGGVSNYYNVLRDKFSFEVEFFKVGALKEKESTLEKIKHLWTDWMRFHKLLRKNVGTYDLIHLNPSFNFKAIVRDGFLLRIAKRFGLKAVVMFHGWDEKVEEVITGYLFNLFFSTYNKADAFIVLASDFKNRIRDWGFKQPVYLETTPVDNNLLDGFLIKNRIRRINSDRVIKLLFLARIEKVKGVYVTIKAVKVLSKKYQTLHLVVAGVGTFLEEARKIANIILKNRVSFLGYVKGEKKKDVFLNSDIYIFPTYHGEGMPTSILEAMAFGLPVVTRPVGGVKDFFINGEHGFMTESKDPAVFASLIERVISNKDLWKRMSVNVHEFAKERFMASKVAKRMECIYRKTLMDS